MTWSWARTKTHTVSPTCVPVQVWIAVARAVTISGCNSTDRTGDYVSLPTICILIKNSPLRIRMGLSSGVGARVLNFSAHADRNYWTTTGWEDDAVPDFDEGACGRVEGRAGDAGGHGESAGAAAARFGEAV